MQRDARRIIGIDQEGIRLAQMPLALLVDAQFAQLAVERRPADPVTEEAIDIPVPGSRALRVPVAIDPALIAPGGRHQVTPMGGARGRYLLVIDSYASRPQGLSRCQAGQESWVRLIDLRTRREIYHRLVESCLTNVEPGDPPARWTADGQGITLDLVSSAPVNARIATDGTVTETPAP